jgi:hypothetical protein
MQAATELTLFTKCVFIYANYTMMRVLVVGCAEPAWAIVCVGVCGCSLTLHIAGTLRLCTFSLGAKALKLLSGAVIAQEGNGG